MFKLSWKGVIFKREYKEKVVYLNIKGISDESLKNNR